MHLDDTIAAIASAPGGALRGIVRLSGPQCAACVAQVFESAGQRSIAGIRVPSCLRGEARLPRELGRVPATLYLWPTERSYTRQPSAELHLPGSPPLLEAALEAVCAAGARLARPGEFTLRAFLAGRLDLTQAEAVLGVIDARSQAQFDAALAQLGGGLARPLHALREELLDLLAHLEAGLDFVEEDIEFISREHLVSQLAAAARRVEQIAGQMQSRGTSGELPRVVLVGPPNAGKSSLLNALAGGDAAIVSHIAGTTRDYVARRVVLHSRDQWSRSDINRLAPNPLDGRSPAGPAGPSVECLLIDTAGLDADTSVDAIAAAAQDASRSQQEQAELLLVCIDASIEKGSGVFGRNAPYIIQEDCLLKTPDHVKQTLLAGVTPAPLDHPPRLTVWTKCDLVPGDQLAKLAAGGIVTSSRAGAGLDELRQHIAAALESRGGESVVAGTADRCRESLCLAAEALNRAQQAALAGLGEELVAAEVRLALNELGQVVGAVYTDDVLDRVFSRFCIGK